ERRYALALGVAAGLSLAAMAGLVLSACDTVTTACDRSGGVDGGVLYTEGDASDDVYRSSAWDGELLYFPGGMRYRIEHHLGSIPSSIELYLSFDQYGTRNGAGTLAPAAGDQAQIVAVDKTTLT